MADDTVDLQAERARTADLLKTAQKTYVPLPVAAAITFHQAHRSTKATITRRDYEDALNIAAAALSRLIPVYQLKDVQEGRVPVSIDLTRQRFTRGATEMQARGEPVARNLSVRYSELVSAVSLIKRTGLPFLMAEAPAGAPQAPRPVDLDQAQRPGQR